MRKRWGIIIAVIVGVVATAIAVVQATGPAVSTVPVPLNTLVLATEAPRGPANEAATEAGLAGGTGPIDGVLFVHVVGGVIRPGLYRLDTDARVVDAVMAAGGLSPDGSQCGVNLARPVKDGEQIIVPQAPPGTPCQQASSRGAAAGSAAPLSLSTASAAQLDSLPGIGPALAQRIIDFREAHGAFTDVAQLNDVSGIGDKVLANIAPLVTP